MRKFLLNLSVIRKDQNVIDLLCDANSVFGLKFHNKCYAKYTHSSTLSRIVKAAKDIEECDVPKEKDLCHRSSQRKRDRGGIFLLYIKIAQYLLSIEVFTK